MSQIYTTHELPQQKIAHVWDKRLPRSGPTLTRPKKGKMLDRKGTWVMVRWPNFRVEWIDISEKWYGGFRYEVIP